MLNLPLNLPGNLPFWPIVISAGIAHLAIGAFAACIAQRKGHDLRFWLPLGLLIGTPALIGAWRLPPR